MRRRILAAAVGMLLFSSVAVAENRGQALAGYLVLSEGNVELKRFAWKGFFPVRAPARLEWRDQLRLEDNAHALVLCVDFKSTRPLTRGERSNAAQSCRKPSRTLAEIPTGIAVSTRGQEISERIRSPRGAIRELAPRIRWESFGPQEYEVQVVLGREKIWGPVLVAGTEQEIPSGFLDLEKPYWLQLRPAGTSQFFEPVIPFYVIADDQRAQIDAEERALLAQFLKEKTEKQLAQALYLAHQHLWDEALTILDSILPKLDSASSELFGAHLALGLGFQHGAFERYEKAKKLAENQGELETKAEALLGLARITENRHLAEHFVRTAISAYDQLGDVKRISNLRKEFKLLP